MVQGTMSTVNLLKVMPELQRRGINVKLVAVPSPQLFWAQPEEYRAAVITEADKWDSTFITNRSRRTMYDWIFNSLAAKYAMSSDFDNRWRTGGNLDEVIAEAQLDPKSIVDGIEKFANDRPKRLEALRKGLDSC